MGSIARHRTLPAREHPPGPSWPLAQARPEDVFLLWLLQLPEGADIAEAARKEIVRLDGAAPLAPGPARLRELMAEAVETGSPRVSRKHRPAARRR